MDNLTHSLVGLAAAKAGLDRLSPGATALCVLAANSPDVDVVSILGGRWASMHYHRGITHSILGTFSLAIILPLIFYLLGLLASRIRGKANPLKLKGLLLASLLVTATHPLLDWTNNYGLRPLLPWSGKWFYGDMVFIVDPVIWLTLGGAAFLLTTRTWLHKSFWILLALITTAGVVWLPLRNPSVSIPVAVRIVWLAGLALFVSAHLMGSARRWGRLIPSAALALVVVYCCALASLHSFALSRASVSALSLASGNGESLRRVAAMPTLANPLDWRAVAETDGAIYRFETRLAGGGGNGNGGLFKRYPKPEGQEATLAAKASQDWRARIFLEFARFPAVRVEGDCLTQTLVQFADLRFTEPGSPGGFALEVPVECDTLEGDAQK